MPLRKLTAVVLIVMMTASTGFAQSKREARVVPMQDQARINLVPVTRLATADTCLVSAANEITHRIDDWVIGNELYKNYLDPERSGCSYPYTITAVNMPMFFSSATTLSVSVDIEAVDNSSVPGCNLPGEMLSLSTDWDITIPAGGGFFDIWIPLDTPLVVYEPFFAGFFLGTEIDQATSPAIVIDTTRTDQCISYNIWDPEMGYVDLLNNEIWNFPGILVLYVTGFSGGGISDDPVPIVSLVNPTNGGVEYAETELWATDHSGSTIIDYVSFEYSNGGAFVEIARDFDGSRPLRDGVSSTEAGYGFSAPWDFSAMPEGSYVIRVSMYDTLGRHDEDEVTVFLEPTPPLPKIVSPNEMTDFCTPLKLIFTCNDDNISYIQAEYKIATDDYSVGMTTLYQNLVGDVNGNPADGNWVSAGEFGDYYNGPVAAALAAKLWFDRGYPNVMKEGTTFLSVELLAEQLATSVRTRENFGTYDEDMFYGLTHYFATHGDDLKLDYQRLPDYLSLRKWVQAEERAVILGVGGEAGFWLTVDGFKGWPNEGIATISVSVPMTGAVMDLPMRSSINMSELFFNGTWHSIDIMISMMADNWASDYDIVGVDFQASDGWSLTWIPNGLVEDSKYFFRGWTQDATNYEGSYTALLSYNCSQIFTAGDYDGDGRADMADLSLLIDFITRAGQPPEGGAGRADTNCDNLINPSDIVFFMNYLYGSNSEPCY